MEVSSSRTKKKLKLLSKILIGIFAILFVEIVVFVIAGIMPMKEYKGAVRKSIYLTMKDGVKIPVRYTLPSNIKAGEKIPAVIESTRYSTGAQPTFIGNALYSLGILEDDTPPIVKQLIESKHAYILVQARGSGISFGKRDIEFSKAEINDSGQVIDWIINQPWSNGRVGAYGIS